MRELTWRWTLPSGDAVKATVDHRRDIESVWLGSRLASRSRIGQRPEGHIVGLTLPETGPYRSRCSSGVFHEAHVIFDHAPPTCALWLGSLPLIPDDASRLRQGARLAIIAVMVGALLAAIGWAW